MKCKYCGNKMELEEFCYVCPNCKSNHYEENELWEVECECCSNCISSEYEKVFKYEGKLMCESCFLNEIGCEENTFYTYPDAETSFEDTSDLIEHYQRYESDLEVI